MDFLIRALALWRISSLLVDELGPWDILWKFRKATGIEYYDNTDPHSGIMRIPAWNPFGCVWCASLWLSPLAYALPVSALKPLALSGAAILVGGLKNDGSL